MIVLGAGRGHDARLFAQHGFEVLAVDFATEAVAAMHVLNNEAAPVQVLQADIFELPETMNGRFGLHPRIYLLLRHRPGTTRRVRSLGSAAAQIWRPLHCSVLPHRPASRRASFRRPARRCD